jgi:hypothetical protein
LTERVNENCMSLPFIHRPPTKSEQEQLRLVLGTFCDGSGMIENGSLPGWRDVERTVATVFGGEGFENKHVFDVTAKIKKGGREVVGYSCKCKNLSGKNSMEHLQDNGRVYMELANSPAKFWDALKPKGLSEKDFKSKKYPKRFGDTVIETVHQWHADATEKYTLGTQHKLILDQSVYLTLSYGKHPEYEGRVFQWHSFPLEFPSGIVWKFRSSKSLMGFDPEFQDEIIFDWYGLSGGQLKYYPRAANALFSSALFQLEDAPKVSLLTKASEYWPEKWKAATKAS